MRRPPGRRFVVVDRAVIASATTGVTGIEATGRRRPHERAVSPFFGRTAAGED